LPSETKRGIKCTYPVGCDNVPESDYLVGAAEADSWLCPKHVKLGSRFGVSTLDFVLQRISRWQSTDESRIRFVVRELVQNADDAEATILVLRFEEKALYAANNGRWFSTEKGKGEKLADFDGVAEILNREKYEKKEVAGNFGSGFQTVFSITNLPEIHSHGLRQALNPVTEKPERGEGALYSPYTRNENESTRGVLFRFPWRDGAEAIKEYDGRKVFEDANLWPRWSPEEIEKAYEDLRQYAHEVILCCQHLRTFRVVWGIGGAHRAYQATRDYDFKSAVPEPVREVTVVGTEATETADWYLWNGGREEGNCPPSFSPDAPRAGKETVWRYLLASGVVRDADGVEVRIKKDPAGNVTIGPGGPGKDEIKNNLIHIFFALSPAVDPSEKTALLFSIIPLPARSPNRFAFTAHLFPMEGRDDVDVNGNQGQNRRWYQMCMLSVAKLYRHAFGRFLSSVASSKGTDEEKLGVVLSNLPRANLNEWMRPKAKLAEDTDWAKEASKELFDWLFEQPVMVKRGGQWESPSRAYRIVDAAGKSVADALRLSTYPEELLAFAKKEVRWLEERCQADDRRFGPDKFPAVWHEIVMANGSAVYKGMRYNEQYELPWSDAGLVLSKANMTLFIRFALPAAKSLAIVPSAEGSMNTIDSFKKVPDSMRPVEELFPTDWKVHPDVAPAVADVEETNRLRDALAVNDIPGIMSKAIVGQHGRFEILTPPDHLAISKTLVSLVKNGFSRGTALGLEILPYRMGNTIGLGRPPDIRPDKEAENRTSPGEVYNREWIFAKKRQAPFDGLPSEVKSKIRFLELTGVSDEDWVAVEQEFLLAPLAAQKDLPTVFARHFLSSKPMSLFFDEELGRFIGTNDKSTLDRVKKTMLLAARQYWDKKKGSPGSGVSADEMGEIPCLYDKEGRWYKAKDFALEGGALAATLKLRTLAPELSPPGWEQPSLEALGVTMKIGPKRVRDRIIELTEDSKTNRAELATLFGAVVVQFAKDDLDDLQKLLGAIQWVPTMGGSTAETSKVLYATDDNISILGPRFHSYVDTNLIDADALNALHGLGEDLRVKLQKLKVRLSPDVRDMLEAVKWHAKLNAEPPRRLFDELSAREVDKGTETKLPEYMFWKAGRWYKGDRVRILNEKDQGVVSFDPAEYLLLGEEDAKGCERYLSWIGAVRGLHAEDFLKALKEMAGRTDEAVGPAYTALWKRLDDEAALPGRRYENVRIVWHEPSKNWYTPRQVLVLNESFAPAAVGFEKALVLPRGQAGKALPRLGAHSAEALDRNEAYELMWNFAGAEEPSLIQATTYSKLLALGIGRWWEEKPTRALPLVCMHHGRRSWIKPPQKAAIGNLSLASVMTNIPLVDSLIDGQRSAGLEWLARAWGNGDLMDLVSYPDMQPGSYQSLEEAKEIIAHTWAGATRIYGVDSKHLQWLATMEVRSAGGNQQRYTSTLGSGKFDLPALLPVDRGRTALVLASWPGVGAHEAELISRWAVAEGFPESKRSDLAMVLMDKMSFYSERSEAAAEEEEEDRREDELERLSPAYPEVRKRLMRWYEGCQVCGYRTPYDEELGAYSQTMECVKRVFGKKSVMYFEDGPSILEIGNSLYLCPRHAKLASRQLLRFAVINDFEDKAVEAREKEERLLAMKAEVISQLQGDGFYHMEIDVFAQEAVQGKNAEQAAAKLLTAMKWRVEPPEHAQEPTDLRSYQLKEGWSPYEDLSLTAEHAESLYDRLLSYVKGA
jgi:hypothetical protein